MRCFVLRTGLQSLGKLCMTHAVRGSCRASLATLPASPLSRSPAPDNRSDLYRRAFGPWPEAKPFRPLKGHAFPVLIASTLATQHAPMHRADLAWLDANSKHLGTRLSCTMRTFIWLLRSPAPQAHQAHRVTRNTPPRPSQPRLRPAPCRRGAAPAAARWPGQRPSLQTRGGHAAA